MSPWIYWLQKFKPWILPLFAVTATPPWGSMKTGIDSLCSQTLRIPHKNGTSCHFAVRDTPNPSAGSCSVQFLACWSSAPGIQQCMKSYQCEPNRNQMFWKSTRSEFRERGWGPLKGFSQGKKMRYKWKQGGQLCDLTHLNGNSPFWNVLLALRLFPFWRFLLGQKSVWIRKFWVLLAKICSKQWEIVTPDQMLQFYLNGLKSQS